MTYYNRIDSYVPSCMVPPSFPLASPYSSHVPSMELLCSSFGFGRLPRNHHFPPDRLSSPPLSTDSRLLPSSRLPRERPPCPDRLSESLDSYTTRKWTFGGDKFPMVFQNRREMGHFPSVVETAINFMQLLAV